MARHKKPYHVKNQSITPRLPGYMIDFLREKGINQSKLYRDAVMHFYGDEIRDWINNQEVDDMAMVDFLKKWNIDIEKI